MFTLYLVSFPQKQNSGFNYRYFSVGGLQQSQADAFLHVSFNVIKVMNCHKQSRSNNSGPHQAKTISSSTNAEVKLDMNFVTM